MDLDLNVLAILFLVVVAPLWIIFHYGTKAHEKGNLTPDDEKMLEDLWKSARKMEHRIEALESVLDLDPDDARAAAARSKDAPADRLM